MALEQFANNAESTLTAAINNAVTSLIVTNGSAFPAAGNFRLRCDSEIMLCTSRTGNNLTVLRAQEGTLAATHAGGSKITHILTAGSLDAGIRDRTAQTWNVVTVGPVGSGATYTCDGTADQVEWNAAITAANAASPNVGLVQVLPGTYFIDDDVVLKSNVVLRGSGQGSTKVVVATGFSNSNLWSIGGAGTETSGTAILLTANAVHGDTVLSVANSAELTSVAVDSYLFLATDALWSPEQSPNSNRKGGEFVRVKSVDTVGNTITIYGMVRWTYKTSDNASLYRMTFLENCGIENLEIYQQDALGTRSSCPVLLGIQKARNAWIRNCRAHHSDGPGISMHSVLDGDIAENYIHDLTDNTGANQFGYGILLSGACENLTVTNNKVSRVRHAVTTGSINTASPAGIILRGIQRGVLCYGNVASHTTDSAFDTHAETENFAFISNVASNSQGAGFFLRGRSHRVAANTVEWCSMGIRIGSNTVDVSSGQAAGSEVVGNLIRHLKGRSSDNYSVGLSLCLTEHCIVQGNTVSAVDGAGLEMRFGAQYNIVRNNTFLNCNLDNNATTLADCIYLEGSYSGVAASLTFSGGVITATGLTNMSPSLVGKKIVITGATNLANNGTFTITSYISASSVTWSNASGSTDTNNGAVSWLIESVCDNIIEGNLGRNTGASLFDQDNTGHAKWMVRVFGGTGQNTRNVIRNNVGIGMESGVISAPSGNYLANNPNNEGFIPKSGTAAPVDSDFLTVPSPGTLSVDATNGLLYFRRVSANQWGRVIHADATTVTLPVATLQYASSVLAPAINQGSTGSGSGQNLSIQAQNSTDPGIVNGGSLFLSSGTGTSPGSIRLCVGGSTGIQIDPSNSGLSRYRVVTGATSVVFDQADTSSAVAASWTCKAQNSTSGTGGDFVVTSGTGTSTSGKVRLQAGGVDTILADNGGNVAFHTSTGSYGGGVKVRFVANRTTAPTTNPSGGYIEYSENGIPYVRTSTGVVQALMAAYKVTSIPDSTYIAQQADYQAKILEVTGTLTGPQVVEMPATAGYEWTFFNNTVGGFGVTFKAAGQTGMTVAAGAHARGYSNGTDVRRATADV